MNPSRYSGLISSYKKIKPKIRERIAEFRPLHKASDEKIFTEMCYCILTANANATRCNEAIVELDRKGLLLKGEPRHIRPVIKGKARFHNKKADYIVGARNLLKRDGSLEIKSKLNAADIVRKINKSIPFIMQPDFKSNNNNVMKIIEKA